MRNLLILLASLILMAISPAIAANQCRDAKGKFVKCPDKKPDAPKRCKDAKGKFAKCGTLGAKPIN